MDARFNNTLLALTIASQCLAGQPENQKAENTSSGIKPLNVVFILSDDHRYDYMGFMGTIPWLETPSMGKVQILAVLTMDGCLSSELYDKAHQDFP